jgi:hypothetical protein
MEAKTRIAHAAPRLSREEFRAWVARQPRGLYERVSVALDDFYAGLDL